MSAEAALSRQNRTDNTSKRGPIIHIFRYVSFADSVRHSIVVAVRQRFRPRAAGEVVCPTKSVNRPHDAIATECVGLVRDQIGPVAALKQAVVVD